MTSPPQRSEVQPEKNGCSHRYARKLLRDLHRPDITLPTGPATHPARLWAESGMMALTGQADRPPSMCPVPLASCAEGVLDAFRALAGKQISPALNGSQLLAERAALTGHTRQGAISPGGHCRLLATGDGRVGLNLSRDSDWDLLPALFESGPVPDWQTVADLAAERDTGTLVTRGRLLGLALVEAAQLPAAAQDWLTRTDNRAWHSARPKTDSAPRVVDLSSLWAGPLCSSLWQAAGAEVLKVESSQRPDGARFGPAAFFHLLNDGKQTLSLDLHQSAGREELRQFILQADIVLEASRPRALRQMGIVAEDLLAAKPGLTWVSITGYGRHEPMANWIAYGDDAGIAAGLSAILHRATDQWLVCGDAVADPLTGLHAALAGWGAWLSGGGQLLDLPLAGVVGHCISATAPADGDYRARQARWKQFLRDRQIAPQPPRPRDESRP